MDKIPPPPQQVAVLGSEGKLSLPWNLWLTEFIKTLQNVGDGLDALGLYGNGSGGGVASSGGGPAADLSLYPSSEGTSNLGARADHLHQMALQAEADATDLGLIQAINTVGPILSVKYEPNLYGSLLTGLYAYLPMTEASGTRYKTQGSATFFDLSESGGSVASTTGRFGLATSSAYTDTQSLVSACTPVTLTSGFTIGCFGYSHSESGGGGSHAYQNLFLGQDAPDIIRLVRHRVVGSAYAGWAQLVVNPGSGSVTTPEIDATRVPRDSWYSVLAWVDPATWLCGVQVGTNPPAYSTGTADTSAFVMDDVMMLGPSTWDAWDGRAQSFAFWNRCLTANERNLWASSVRASVEVNPAALELFGG